MPILAQDQLVNNRYQLVQRIGQGGFSVVWLARDTQKYNAQVAIKIFAPKQGLDQTNINQFKTEFDLTSSLRDSRLLKATDHFVLDDSPCLVFPYMPGGSLDKAIKDQRMPEAEVAKLLYQVCGGLNYLHSQKPRPVLHLDIKPENILIDYTGDYVLADFGISAQMRSTIMRSSGIKGETMTHKAPERITGGGATPKVDIFALGVTLFECCEGILDGSYLIGFNLAKGLLRLPEIDKGQYTKRMEELVQACLLPDPQQRPTAAKLESYARHRLEKGFWPPIEEFTTALRPVPTQAATAKPTPQPQRQAPFSTPMGSAPVAAKGSGRSTVDLNRNRPKPAPVPVAPAAKPVAKKAKKKKKKSGAGIWVGAVVAILAILGVGGYFGNKMIQFDDHMHEAKRHYRNEQLGMAMINIQEARGYFPDDEQAIRLEENIVDKAFNQFDDLKVTVGNFMSNRDYDPARQTMNDNYDLSLVIPDSFELFRREQVEFPILRDSGNIHYRNEEYLPAIEYFTNALSFKEDDDVRRQLDDAIRREKAIRLAEVNAKLIKACKSGDLNGVSIALSEEADPNAHEDNTPAILFAVKRGDVDIVRKLVDSGANCSDRTGYLQGDRGTFGSPAVVAAGYGKATVLRYLLEECNVPIDEQEYDPGTGGGGWTPLGTAAARGHLDIAQYLVSRGAYVNFSMHRGLTPLMEACSNNHYDVAQYLIEQGAGVNETNDSDNDAYDLTSDSNIKALLKRNGGGRFVFYDDFSQEGKFTVTSNTNYASLYRDGNLITTSKNESGGYNKDAYFPIDLEEDVEITTEVMQLAGGPGAAFGLYLFGGGNQKYYLLMDSDEEFAFNRYDGEHIRLKNWGSSSNLRSTRSYYNKIKLVISGNKLKIYFNDNYETSVNISPLYGRNFGFYVEEKASAKYNYLRIEGYKR